MWLEGGKVGRWEGPEKLKISGFRSFTRMLGNIDKLKICIFSALEGWKVGRLKMRRRITDHGLPITDHELMALMQEFMQ